MNKMNIRKWCANQLRYKFDRPLYPKRQGHGVLPWVSGPELHTRFFLNMMRDPSSKIGATEIEIIRFSSDGTIISSDVHTAEIGNVLTVDLPESEEFSYGYCWVIIPERKLFSVAPQFHVQIMAPHSFGKTHGRAKGIPLFEEQQKVDSIIEWLDPFPYAASSAISSETSVKFGLLLVNVSNRGCDVVRADNLSNILYKLEPHGATFLFEDPSQRDIAAFRGTAPFTMYLMMMRPDQTGITIQHIQDLF